MTGVARQRMTSAEARAETDAIKVDAERLHARFLACYEGEAWRALDYVSFRGWAEAEFGMSQSYAYRLLDLGRVVREIETSSPIGEKPNEAQARELARVEPEHRAEVWRETVERTEGKPTAAAVRAVRVERTEPAPPPQAPAPSGPVTASGAADDVAPDSPADEYRQRYPTIDRPAVDDAKAVEYGTYLDGLDEYERAGRVENLTRTLDNRDAGVKAPQLAEPEAVAAFHRLAEAIVEANSRTSRYRRALPALLDDAKPYVDGMEWGLALSAADDLRGLLGDLLDHSQSIPSLRSVR